MKANVVKSAFGKLPNGQRADLFTLTNRHGLVCKVTNYGTIITELHVPDRRGKLGDIVLGFDELAGYTNKNYLKGCPYFGATCGRVANRIAGGRFALDGKTFQLATNNGPNALHGGVTGFDKVLWQAKPLRGASVRFDHVSPAGDEGYPGKLTVTVIMVLTDAGELVIDYTAKADRPTPVNLTNHTYFNLAGRGDIRKHMLTLPADFYTPVDATLIPTGEIRPVKNTPFDFTKACPIGKRFKQLGGKPPGYDHNFVLRGDAANSGAPALAARVVEPGSGRIMEVLTTEPGVQLYTGNFLNGSLTGKGGNVYDIHTGFCLETQRFPDAVHHNHFPNTILRPGETYHQLTVHRFSAK
ncbi:MAG: aldose epimerase family protein [Verrucomicrobiota bacterium]